MSFNIIDKNPRKPRVEGKKAQEAYCEGLHNDWIGDHALNRENTTVDLEDQVPADVRLRAEQLEAETMDKLRRESERKNAMVVETIRQQDRERELNRAEFLLRKAHADRLMYGHVRDQTLIEALELGLELV